MSTSTKFENTVLVQSYCFVFAGKKDLHLSSFLLALPFRGVRDQEDDVVVVDGPDDGDGELEHPDLEPLVAAIAQHGVQVQLGRLVLLLLLLRHLNLLVFLHDVAAVTDRLSKCHCSGSLLIRHSSLLILTPM